MKPTKEERLKSIEEELKRVKENPTINRGHIVESMAVDMLYIRHLEKLKAELL